MHVQGRVLFKDDLDLEASFDPSRDGLPKGDQTKSDNAEDDDIRVRRTSLGAQKQPQSTDSESAISRAM